MMQSRPIEIVRGVRGMSQKLQVNKGAIKSLVQFDRDKGHGVITRDDKGCYRADATELWWLYKLWCSSELSV